MSLHSAKTREEHDVVIIGAGPAGSAAGLALSSAGKKVCLLEQLDRAGGLSRTLARHGARFDIGPHRFFTKSDRVLNVWKTAGTGELIEVERLTRILYRNHLLNYPLQPMNALAGLGIWNSIGAMASYAAACGRRWCSSKSVDSFEDWVTMQFGSVLYQCFFKTYTEKVWGISCRDISASWASQRIKNLNLPRAVLNAFTRGRLSHIKTLVDRFLYCRHGAGSVYEAMCARIAAQGGHFRPNEEVIKIRHDGRGSITSVLARAGEQLLEYKTNHLISSMPLTELIRRLDPAAPRDVLDAVNQLRYRTHISVNLLVNGNPFPDNWIYVHSPDVHMGRVANYRNFSAAMCPDQRLTPLTFEYFTFDGDEVSSLNDSLLVDLALSEGRRVGLLDGHPPVDAFVVRSPRAYCVIQRGHEKPVEQIKSYLAGFRNLATVGRAGMFKYNNQDHSIMTGLLAADNLLGGCLDVWSVNIDAEYHESGTAPDLCVEDREEVYFE
jgi:protoporphyrinogen oxidase